MEDEPWDELMGPSPEDLRKMLTTKETPVQPVVRSTPGSAPPSNMFAQMPGAAVAERWSQHEASPEESRRATQNALASARKGLPIEDEDAEDTPEHRSFVRDEAMRILEYADESNYSVQKTSTGGIAASHNGFEDRKRVPKALSGLSFTSSRRNEGRKFRDLDLLDNTKPHRVDLEYGDEDVVDVINMEKRFASSRPAEPTSNSGNWSDRYSLNNTLLGMSGGAVSNSGLLRDIDMKHERQAARNLFGGKKNSNVFGRGFKFRKNNVFGKQGVVIPQRNLQTVWVDADDSPSSSPAKSWQEQLSQKRKQRRNYILVAVAAVGIIVALSTMMHKRANAPTSNTYGFPKPGKDQREVSFYATSDTPLNAVQAANLRQYIDELEGYGQADLLVHLGNMQDPDVSQCDLDTFVDVANILGQSPYKTLVVPGVDDWRNCPDEDEGWANWWNVYRHFGGEETIRQKFQEENWAYHVGGVLFLGVHVVDGDEDEIDMGEQTTRNMGNVKWIQNAVMHFGQDVRAVVIFGNAKPSEGSNDLFWVELGEIVAEQDHLPYLYVHGNSGQGGTEFYRPFEDVKHVYGVQVQKGGNAPPVRIRVGMKDLEKNPFSLS